MAQAAAGKLQNICRQSLSGSIDIQLQAYGRFDTSGGAFSATVDLPQPLQVEAFFVAAPELVDHAAVQHINLQGNQLLLQQPLNTYFSGVAPQIELVLVTANAAYSVQLTQAGQGAAEILVTQKPHRICM